MFKETADIQTADMLKLPVPEAHYHSVVLKPSETQKEMVASLSERAERVRNKMVDSSVDNMLLITNDGRKLALDQRLMNDMLPDSETSKVGACADNVFDIWQRTGACAHWFHAENGSRYQCADEARGTPPFGLSLATV